MKNLTLFFLLLLTSSMTFAQQRIDNMEPPNWWIGMKESNVQLLIHGEKIGDFNPTIDYDGVQIERVIKVENANYLFLNLSIASNTKPGTIPIHFFENEKLVESHNWELWQRESNAANRQGFDNSDVLYLITPDRFANGNTNNDAISGMKEMPNRTFKGGRHGGDIEGIRQHLDYLVDMGFTAIWLNPVLENDMPKYSYHGYSTTDFYKVDARFGSNESYRQLVKEANAKGIKVIMDMIVNHCGSEHWWMDDLPTSDWLNTWTEYTQTNHKKSLTQDPYASEADRRVFFDGWFVPTMPDLNQRNDLMANYLTQNSIWWVEYSGISGIRMDTYPYPDMHYMTEWTRRLMEEYPNFNIVGEEWNIEPTIVAYWQRGKKNANGYVSYLPSLMDFPVQLTLADALKSEESWGKGWVNLYEMLAQDFVYADPYNLVTLPDNHDMPRFFAQVGEDYNLFQLGLTFILTVRGIPQIYYGTEILMTSPSERDDGIIRSDFPGGWSGDLVNAFTGKGLTPRQQEAKTFIRKLLQWRKNAPVIHTGKLMHFEPQDGVYVLFRYNENEKAMVVLNKNEQPYTLKLDRFSEMLEGVSKGKDVLSGKIVELTDELSLPVRAPLILELEMTQK